MLFQAVSSNFQLMRSSSIKDIFHGGHLPSDQNFFNSFEFQWSIPTTLRKQVMLFSSYFTTIPGGWTGGRAAGEINTKDNSAQLSWDWGWAWQKEKNTTELLMRKEGKKKREENTTEALIKSDIKMKKEKNILKEIRVSNIKENCYPLIQVIQDLI